MATNNTTFRSYSPNTGVSYGTPPADTGKQLYRGVRTYSNNPSRNNTGATRTYSTNNNEHEIGLTHRYSNDPDRHDPGATRTTSTAPKQHNTTNAGNNSSPENYMKNIRSGNVKNASNSKTSTFTNANWNVDDGYDWRVKIRLPTISPFTSSSILAPLYDTDNALVWPYTPNIIVTHTASYNTVSPTHNNYSYPAYQNSSIEQMTISGGFSVENPYDAEYWIAANHFLRSITKMSYGESPNIGAPPPVVKLCGYGDFVFNEVPIVVESYILTLPDDVDYIKADTPGGANGTWVPTYSDISVTVRVAYSRDSVNQFNLETFVNGGYLNNSSTGFI